MAGAPDSLAAPVGPGPPAAAADSLAPPAAAPRVGRIRVEGNVSADSARVVRTFDIPPGARYAEEAVRRGVRKLFALGLFRDVWVEKQEHGERVDLVIHVTERPRVERIEFRGNRKHENSDLEKKLSLRPGEIYSAVAVQTQVDSLLKYYREAGFARATVTPEVDSLATGGIALRFVISEGEKVKIGRVEFVGATAFKPGVLRKQLKSKARGFLGGGAIKEEDAAADEEKLEAYYHNHGYRDMRLTGRELKPGRDARHVVLVVTVDEGRPYRVGQVAWSGNTVVPERTLAPFWRQAVNEPYDASKIERVQGQAYGEYAEHGYLYVGIEPRETVRDSGVVDIAFQVTEGRPSHIRFVNVLGNKATREKVIRRELDFFEGDRFKRSALVRSQGDLMRLGIFEEVIPDFAPAESSDVDINIKVKEKQVGTASAGAGYTGQTGFTGFLELGHNNVLGNGQSLSLHLERGARLSNYYISFTEPWFHDTPTLLGTSIFNTAADRDVYKERRRGGSVRVGRPLPWPDYSRGSIGYSLEDVTIEQDLSGLDPQQQAVYSSYNNGRPQRTSSVDLDFNRNSTDNPFYPTRGSRLLASAQLAGGPFMGSVSYIKSRYEARDYQPSFLHGLTSMARVRAGVLGIWLDQSTGLPDYERFRLGGGSVSDPLRGYDDYQVVPDKFNRVIVTRSIAGIDSVTTPGVYDTTYHYNRSRVRYPGGRYFYAFTFEQQFPIVAPLHGVLFFDAGNTWDQWREIQPLRLKLGAGIGFRMEIPMLGNIGLDWGYGFNRDDGPRGKIHFLLGNINF